MHELATGLDSHLPDYRRTSGHLYQGQFNSFAVEDDVYFRTLMRYAEANPRNWLSLVNQPLAEAESRRVRDSLARGRPLGSDSWTMEMAKRLGLGYTLRPRGRPQRPVPHNGVKSVK